ncbi:F-box protein At5g07610-like [Rosa rugosa]|uniref:F-box protein At5g07610-like n=1 Tax=Rosa rugosa TaxID=74645 RepID=UPI002B416517|nr:F-box protein At5g07610-like [Rosa rugosa]
MSSSAAEAVANIEELLTQILVSLPLRSLARFKCVSTHWLSLISDLRTLKNPKISAFFSSKIQDECFKSIPLGNHEIPPGWNPFKTLNNSVPDGSKLRILQSCNGLFLCHIPIFGEQRKHHPVYVVNPTTNQFRAVSSPRVGEYMDRLAFVRYALAFDPSKSPHYKVICVTNSVPTIYHYVEREGEHHKIDIYSSETENWKHLNIPFFQSPSDRHRHYSLKMVAMHFDRRSREGAIYCNGAVHWIRETGEARFSFCFFPGGRFEFERKETDVLHYFDIGQERLLLVSTTPPVPLVVKNIPQDSDPWPTEWPRLAQRYFGESGGHLYLIETYKNCKTQFDVMEMERDYSGWFVKYHVDLHSVFTALPDPNAFVILCLSQEKEKHEEEDSSADLLLYMPDKVISYNLKNKTFKASVVELANEELLLAMDGRFYRDEVVMYPYMEGLACVER